MEEEKKHQVRGELKLSGCNLFPGVQISQENLWQITLQKDTCQIYCLSYFFSSLFFCTTLCSMFSTFQCHSKQAEMAFSWLFILYYGVLFGPFMSLKVLFFNMNVEMLIQDSSLGIWIGYELIVNQKYNFCLTICVSYKYEP